MWQRILETIDAQFLIYVGIVVGIMLVFEGIRQMIWRGRTVEDARNRRMKLIADGKTTEEILELLKP